MFGALGSAEQPGQSSSCSSGGARREGTAKKKEKQFEGFEVGARVSLVGLEARKDLNFRLGSVVDPGRRVVPDGRVPVRVEAVVLGGVEVHSSELAMVKVTCLVRSSFL